MLAAGAGMAALVGKRYCGGCCLLKPSHICSEHYNWLVTLTWSYVVMDLLDASPVWWRYPPRCILRIRIAASMFEDKYGSKLHSVLHYGSTSQLVLFWIRVMKYI
ncbi:MAG: hypothetical protein FRX48_08848 [Lasallia pustulata]|uniref:Uncharacterized protein n=1 Tax=Lasallia pustulata TaxID=136370 RepID=A0A5M8PEJ9_9LECA|nr:MAG: hypothetical protein FRX48_08848 [Lasallia pustulata]